MLIAGVKFGHLCINENLLAAVVNVKLLKLILRQFVRKDGPKEGTVIPRRSSSMDKRNVWRTLAKPTIDLHNQFAMKMELHFHCHETTRKTWIIPVRFHFSAILSTIRALWCLVPSVIVRTASGVTSMEIH